jgi:hypothetical protein
MRISEEKINEAINGFSDVNDLNLLIDKATGSYELRIVLAHPSGQSLLLSCRDVSSLRLADFGGGLTQFLAFRCKDVRLKHLDRVSFHFSELERETISFDCSDAQITIM